MEKLSKDWLTHGMIDVEYKQYLLLAYLKTVKDSFRKNALYPFMADLVSHYRNLVALRDDKALFKESFPKEISLDEIKNLELSYKQLIEDDEVMKHLEAIIEFAIPRIKNSLDEGSVIFELVESKCEIAAIGVTPLYAKEGYLFVTQPPENETQVYRYQISIFEDSQEQLRSLNTTFVDSFDRSLANTYERIKLDLIRRYQDLPNPATYLISSKMKFPFVETLMPVAKRLFVKHISSSAQ